MCQVTPLRLVYDRVTASAAKLQLLTFGPDLGAWPDCWVSVEFLYAPIPRKGSSSTITTKLQLKVMLL